MGLIAKLQAKLELYRIEQRYVRRSGRQQFVSDAQYIDGEYVYSSSYPSSPRSPSASSESSPESRRVYFFDRTRFGR